MFIKKIVIQGFKTYKDTTVVEDLSPNFNVVVGKNGLGKSNFFSAIRFVLSDAYTHMTREERHGLIHEGTVAVMSAYVEITFDNQDRRFPIQKDEILVRRTIGLKKDDYSLDSKSSTRSDIMNLLESAGFSRLNPYYIVPQGKITSLTNSKDVERLQLLKEVSGAKMFEARLKESNKEMSSSQFKMDRIDESMEKLHQKLSDLQMELDQLKQFQALEKDKKVLEFNLFDRELASIKSQIEKLDEKYEQILLESKGDISLLDSRENTCQTLQSSVDELASKLKIVSLDLTQSIADQKRVTEAIVTKEAAILSLSNALGYATEMAQEEREKIEASKNLIAKNKLELSELLLPQLAPLKDQESKLKMQLSDAFSMQRALFSKKGRYQQFSSKSERDQWIKAEIASLKKQIQDRNKKFKLMDASIKEKTTLLNEVAHQLQQETNAIEDKTNDVALGDLERQVATLKSELSMMGEERKSLLRQEIKLKAMRDSAENELIDVNNKVTKTMGSAQLKALEAVSGIATRLGMSSNVYGPLVELFSVPDKYKTAVEVIAGNSLFHVVVDTDESALILMQELAKMKVGKLTFMPLNRIKPRGQAFPSQEEQDFIPLVKKIKTNNNEVDAAIAQVFGQTAICGNLQRGSELARQHGLNAITLDGDRVSPKGLLSGGYRQVKNSRLDALTLQRKKRDALRQISSDLEKVTMKVSDIELKHQNASSLLAETSKKLEEYKVAHDSHESEKNLLLSKKYSMESEISSATLVRESDFLALAQLKNKRAQYEEELKSAFVDGLSNEDSEKLESVSKEALEVEELYSNVIGEVSKLEMEISKREDVIANSEALIKKLEDISLAQETRDKHSELDIITAELRDLKKKAPEITENLDRIKSEQDSLQSQLDRQNSELDDLNRQQLQLLRKIEEVGKRSEKVLSKKAILDTRKNELQDMIQLLGMLPEEAFDKNRFQDVSSNDIYESLNSVNVELREYSHINKKALEQYNVFSREKEELNARKKELEVSKESIENLVRSLEQQKDSAIIKSFDEVSKKFSEVFENLVPNGKGELVMRRKENDDGRSAGNSIENYMGVSILVSFNSKENEQQYIEQLSGGQKSLCAISLILAIQKCDPAPFYLFDEIDANLDTQYRSAVAALISSLAGSAQFICTTFRPEMLQAANKFYGISYGDKVSTVLQIAQDEALSFVDAQR